MIALIKKDWRANRTTVVGSLVLTALPYLVMLIAYCTEPDGRHTQGDLPYVISNGASAAMWLTALVGAAFGGAAFAEERRNRSADFVAMLPVTREQIAISKFAAGFGWCACLWLFHLLVYLVNVVGFLHMRKYASGDFAANTELTIAISVMLFGVAWALSTVLVSPTIAATVSIGTTVALWVTTAMIISQQTGTPGRADDLILHVVSLLTFVIGVTAILGGSLYYVHRIEP